jgi:hypothetical protein
MVCITDGPLPASSMNIRKREEELKMDIIKAIEQEQIKTDLPPIEIGDFVKVHVKVKEGTRERMVVSLRLSPYVKFHTVLVWNEYSRLIHRGSITSRSYAKVR